MKLIAQSAIRCGMKTKTFQHNPKATSPLEAQWPAHLDALVAAPQHHKLLYENDRVRVLEVRIPRGETVPVHTHRWPAVLHLQSWSDHIRRDEAGRIVFDSRKAGPGPNMPAVVWCEPLAPHSVENVGDAELLVLSIELKDSE
jgi:hypothetical protein